MKNSKPVYYLLGGSGLLLLVCLVILLFVHFQVQNLPFYIIAGVPLATGFLAFVVFYLFVERFINNRLGVLYRSIRKGKFVGQRVEPLRLTDDVFELVEKETRKWAEEQHTEISKLKEQEAFRKEFLGNLAHELKTPLFSIQGYVLTLLDGGLEDEQVNRLFLERASVSIDRMVALLEDLDSITKIEMNGLNLDLENFDIKKCISDVFDSLELKAKEKEIQLRFSKENSAIMVYGDRAKIQQVLTNLIANSIYYGNEKGTTTARFFEMNDLMLIEISDDGPGIDAEHLPRLFERFYRVEKSRTRNEGGSGLGLAIAKKVVESHGQTLTVRSSVGLGSTFAFCLEKAKSTQDSLITSRGIKIR